LERGPGIFTSWRNLKNSSLQRTTGSWFSIPNPFYLAVYLEVVAESLTLRRDAIHLIDAVIEENEGPLPEPNPK
jgi:hypothetical protein